MSMRRHMASGTCISNPVSACIVQQRRMGVRKVESTCITSKIGHLLNRSRRRPSSSRRSLSKFCFNLLKLLGRFIALFDVTVLQRMSLLPLASRIGAGSERLAPSASPSARTTTSASRRRCCRSESSISSGCSSSLLFLQKCLLHLVIGDPRRVHHEERRFEASKLVRKRPEECHGCQFVL